MAKKDTKKDTPRVMTWKVSERFLEYEEWFARFEDEINIELAETGADREMDFDGECEFEKRYEMHLNAH